jgi:alpha-N-acetylglucosaminidase
MLHNYGGNMGLYGQITNVTVDPVKALANSSSLVGFGLTPEGQGGNEIMYKLLLDQAWQIMPIDTEVYFHNWVTTRYAGFNNTIPKELYTAWELLRTSAYNNTNLTSNAVSKAIYELAPNITRLVGRTGHHPTTINYDPKIVVEAWKAMYKAAACEPEFWTHPAYTHDLVDITRQVYSNAFLSTYTTTIKAWNTSFSSASLSNATQTYNLDPQTSPLLTLLSTLDTLLSTLPQFSLAPWILSARNRADNDTSIADFYEYNARNQITQWGPNGENLDYASKSWSGLVGDYYLPRWRAFLEYLGSVRPKEYTHGAARHAVMPVEVAFQRVGSGLGMRREERSVKDVVEGVVVPALKGLGVV